MFNSSISSNDKFKRVHSSVFEVRPEDEMYTQLKSLEENRNLKELNVLKLHNAIQANNLLHLRPIIIRKVKEEWVIIDGQHRYSVARTMNIPYFVMLDEGTDPLTLITLNTHQRNWNLKDFAKFWAATPETSEVYTRFIDYKERYLVTFSILIAIFGMKTSSKGGAFNFKEGKLRYDHTNANHVEDTLSKIDKLRNCAMNPPLADKTLQKQQFQQALLKCFATPSFKYDNFLRNLARCSNNFNNLGNQSAYQWEILRIERKGK